MSFSKKLFTPMRTKTRVDEFFSAEKGVMPGTNVVITGDPGVGKTTVLLDILGDLQSNGKKCLFISGEMNAIDMVGYVRRYPKFGQLDILFMGDYSEVNPDVVLRTALEEGYDCVMMDSLAEISDNYVDYFGGTGKSNTNRILQLLDEHNQGGNKANIKLGWYPKWNFQTTVQRTVEWYRAVREGASALDSCLCDINKFEEQ